MKDSLNHQVHQVHQEKLNKDWILSILNILALRRSWSTTLHLPIAAVRWAAVPSV
jgi:hypothetical protein